MSSLFGAVEDMCLKKISKALEIVQIFFWLISGIFYSNDCVCDKKKMLSTAIFQGYRKRTQSDL